MPYELIDEAAVLDYSCDWSAFLADGGSPADVIASSAWSIAPQAGSPAAPALSGAGKTATTATVFVSNCQRGEVYRLTNRITTAQGRTDERTITLLCENR